MVRTQNGFEIAELDLQQRGPGEFFGTRQAGMPNFRVANLLRDRDLLEAARKEARYVLAGPERRSQQRRDRSRRAASAQPLEPALWVSRSGMMCSQVQAKLYPQEFPRPDRIRIQENAGTLVKEILTSL